MSPRMSPVMGIGTERLPETHVRQGKPVATLIRVSSSLARSLGQSEGPRP